MVVVSLAAAVSLVGGGIWYNARLQDEVRQRKAQQGRAVAHLQTAIDVLEHQLAELHSARRRGYAVPAPLQGDLLEHAAAFYQKLLANADDPDPAVRRAIGRAYHGFGLSSEMQIGLSPDQEADARLRRQAEDDYQKAIAIQEPLLAGAPENVDYRIDLAVTLARVMDLQPRGPEHYQTRTRIVALVQALPPDHPRLADMGIVVANELADRGRLGEALSWLDQHILRLETLRGRTQPGRNLEVMNRAVYSLYVTRAVLLAEMGEYVRALAAWDQVLALGEVAGASPGTAEVRLDRALTLIHLGRHEEAVREAEQTVGSTADGRNVLIAAAVVSLAAGQAHQDTSRSASARALLEDQYGGRAVALLRRAQAAGWFAKPGQLDKLKTDPDFAPLRSRDDFQRLLAEAETAAQPAP